MKRHHTWFELSVTLRRLLSVRQVLFLNKHNCVKRHHYATGVRSPGRSCILLTGQEERCSFSLGDKLCD